ncbi:MAG: ChpI protein [Actinobacteria bacterium]|nr:ChpI protein [Actinomycetota bacterium]MCL5446893.1 ChpI protein [Actinomycetota bacterium]
MVIKTAVSIPDDLFNRAERVARSAGCSRSQFYANALVAYLAEVDDPVLDPVTRRLDEMADEIGGVAAPLAAVSGRRLIDEGMWEW